MYYIPFNILIEKLLKTDTHYSTDLVTLDFKSESLNKYL